MIMGQREATKRPAVIPTTGTLGSNRSIAIATAIEAQQTELLSAFAKVQ
jgi:hypothetical protein